MAMALARTPPAVRIGPAEHDLAAEVVRVVRESQPDPVKAIYVLALALGSVCGIACGQVPLAVSRFAAGVAVDTATARARAARRKLAEG